MDAYKILGIAVTASREQIDAAYREQVKRLHPDIGGDAEAFKQVQLAYEKLTANAIVLENAHSAAAGRSGAGAGTGFESATFWARHDAAVRQKAAAATWNGREKARSEQTARSNDGVEETVRAVDAAVPEGARLLSLKTVLVASALVAAVDFAAVKWHAFDDWRLVILLGSAVPALLIGRLCERPVTAALGVFLLAGALMVVATWCVGFAHAIEYERLREWSDKDFDFNEVNEFFRITSKKLTIVTARWGCDENWVDVTAIVRETVARGEAVQANDASFGSIGPAACKCKQLQVTYEKASRNVTVYIDDGGQWSGDDQ